MAGYSTLLLLVDFIMQLPRLFYSKILQLLFQTELTGT